MASGEKKPRGLTIWVGIIIVLGIALGGGLMISTYISQRISQVTIKVEYNGNWQGAYGESSGSLTSWNGQGTKTVTLNRPSGASIWIVVANAQKMDDSGNTLRIMIMKTDGTILKEGSTNAPYGIAQISYTVQY